jgi:hypothetical protein
MRRVYNIIIHHFSSFEVNKIGCNFRMKEEPYRTRGHFRPLVLYGSSLENLDGIGQNTDRRRERDGYNFKKIGLVFYIEYLIYLQYIHSQVIVGNITIKGILLTR